MIDAFYVNTTVCVAIQRNLLNLCDTLKSKLFRFVASLGSLGYV